MPYKRRIHGLCQPPQQVGRNLLRPGSWTLDMACRAQVWGWHKAGACVDCAGCVVGRAKVVQQRPPDQDDSCQNCGLLILTDLPTVRHWKGEGTLFPRKPQKSEKLCYFTGQAGPMLSRAQSSVYQTKMGYLAHLAPSPAHPIRERLGHRTHPDTHPLSISPAQAGSHSPGVQPLLTFRV